MSELAGRNGVAGSPGNDLRLARSTASHGTGGLPDSSGSTDSHSVSSGSP